MLGQKMCIRDSAKGFEQLHYYGMNQTSKKWGVQETYGGKLVAVSYTHLPAKGPKGT